MLAEGLSTRYEFGGETVADALMRRTPGKRLEDGREVTLVIFEDAAGVGQAQGVKGVEAATALAGLGLSPVMACLEAGRDDDGHVYMVFEAPDLPSLKSIIKERGGLSPVEALDIVHAVAWTLSQAVSVGVNHLDLSSSTIYCNLQSGEPLKVQIAGFGLGTLLPSYNPAKKTSPYYGNAEYMAPEVCSGRPGNASADLYALGILLYEMVTGKAPFVSAGASTTIKRQVYEKPLPLHLVKPGLPQIDSFEALVMRLLAKDPTGRPASAADVVTAIVGLKSEVFPELSLALEPKREDLPTVVSTFVETLPEPVQMSGSPGATMAFEGLSEAVARMVEAQETAAKESAGQAESEEGVKTEAFDASFIAAVVEQVAAGGDIGEAIADAKASTGGESAPDPTASAETAPRKAAAKATKASAKSAKKAKSSKKVPDTVIPPAPAPRAAPVKQTQSVMKKPAKGGRGGVVAVVVVLALAVLLAVAAAYWFKGRTEGGSTDKQATAESVAPAAVDMERKAADELRARALEKVRLGRMMLDRGDLAGAAAAVKEALEIQKDCAEALKLQVDIDASRPAETPPPAPPAPAPSPEPAVPVVEKPAPAPAAVEESPAPEPGKPAATPRSKRARAVKKAPREKAPAEQPAADVQKAPAPTPEPKKVEPRVEANALRAKARKAYKAGDCATAVSLLEQVRELGQLNNLDAGVIKKCSNKTE